MLNDSFVDSKIVSWRRNCLWANILIIATPSHSWYSKYNTNTIKPILISLDCIFHWKTLKRIKNSHFKLKIAPQIAFYTSDHQKYVLHYQSKFAMISKNVLIWKYFLNDSGFSRKDQERLSRNLSKASIRKSLPSRLLSRSPNPSSERKAQQLTIRPRILAQQPSKPITYSRHFYVERENWAHVSDTRCDLAAKWFLFHWKQNYWLNTFGCFRLISKAENRHKKSR